MQATTMATFLASMGEIATAIWGQVGTVTNTIIDSPLLLFTVGFLFVGGCVAIFGRLLSRR